ncbi:HNH endonuclease signature motif containing protein, partial [Kibdelosporangium lantanae]
GGGAAADTRWVFFQSNGDFAFVTGFAFFSRPASTCDAHHVHSWLKGGPTHIDNLVLLCPHHHRLIHRSDWTAQLVNGKPQFTPPTYIDSTRTPRTNHLHSPPPHQGVMRWLERDHGRSAQRAGRAGLPDRPQRTVALARPEHR